MESIARYVSEGGPLMWPILIALGSGCAVVAERLHFYLHTCRDAPAPLVAAVARAITEGRPDEAVQAIGGRHGPLNSILRVALERYREGRSMPEIRQAVDEAAIRQVPRLTRRLSYLSTIAQVATLVGLLGTILGLQQSFTALAGIGAAESASTLAAGISRAVNTASFGLMVAIPCLVAHALLMSLQKQRTEDLEAGAVRLLNYLDNRTSEPGPGLTAASERPARR
jgi:biopolymer transport protein ExbB/TolQ